MALSNSYNFDPSSGALVIQAFQMCGVRPTALTQEHFQTANMASNLLLGRWSSQGVNLWQVDLQTIALVQGTATYTVPANTVVILDAYVTVTNGATSTNRIIMPISRSEYATYPNTAQQGFPTVYWMDRLLAPTLTLWPVPDGNETSLSYYRLRQSMDSNYTDGQQVEMPYYFTEAFVTALAARLAVIWAPDRAQGLKLLADEAYTIASTQNVETENVYLSPSLQGYWSV